MIYFMICHSQSLIHPEIIVRACPILFSAKLYGLLQEYSFRNRLPALTHQWWASLAPRQSLPCCSHVSMLTLSMSVVPEYQEVLTDTQHGKSGPLPNSLLLEDSGLPYSWCYGISALWVPSQLAGTCFQLHYCQPYLLGAGSCSFSLVLR